MIQSVSTNSDPYRKKCGEIFIFSKENLLLVCDHCRIDYFTLEAFGIHLLNDHLPPQLSTNIKCEDTSSCDSYNAPNQLVERLETATAPKDDISHQSTSFQDERGEMKMPDFRTVILKEEHDEIDIETNISLPISIDSTNQCSFCIKTFESKQKCNDHENMHTGKRPYPCKLCPKTFHSSNSHRYHMKKLHSNERPHKCLVCEKGFIRKTELDKHTREKHLPDKGYFACKQCDEKFITYSNLRSHITTVHVNAIGIFNCDYCQQTFTNRMLIVRHMLKHAPKKELKCTICDKRFFSKKLHDDHYNIHTGNRYQCQLCSKAYLYRASLRRHMTKTHLKVKSDVAVQSTSTRDRVGNTQKTKRPHKCKVCLRTLASSNSLKNHIKLHTNDRHKCLECDKSFIKLHRLNIHTRENHLPDTDPKRYFSCIRCDKKYENYSQLRYHTLDSHTNLSGPYTCDHCQTILNTRRSLLQHMLKHSGKNSFECKVCGKIFPTWYQRDDHENIHSGKRPYQCEFCSKSYTYKPNLTRHRKSHEDGNDQRKPLPLLSSKIKQEK